MLSAKPDTCRPRCLLQQSAKFPRPNVACLACYKYFETASTCASCLSASPGHSCPYAPPDIRGCACKKVPNMLGMCFVVVGSLACLLASCRPCAGDTFPVVHAPNSRKTLQASSPADGPALGSVNSGVWQIGGNASLVSVSLDALQQSATVSSLTTSFSEAPSHLGAKRRLLQGCSCAGCPNTQRIPAQAK